MIDSVAGPAVSPVQVADQINRTTPQFLLKALRKSSLILAEDWEMLAEEARAELNACADKPHLMSRLCDYGLLTEYQAGRVEVGNIFGLVLGNYRVLDRLGAGGMGIVFRAEHCRMRRQVAIKVLSMSAQKDAKLLLRFLAEMRAIAQLQHPNIVAAIDAGEEVGPTPEAPVLHYFVMEYVPGQDLEEHIEKDGPLPVAKACNFMHQIASALDEAHKHNFVHRDIKPSNIRITPEEQAKLLDFGLARHFRKRQTEPGIMLGTVDFIAPEQIQDASSVDIRADIYSLGGTFFWCLTGRLPYGTKESMAEAVTRRLTQPPPCVRDGRPDLPPQLEQVINRMMALKVENRYQTPQAVMRALLPFLRLESCEYALTPASSPGEGRSPAQAHRVLIADDQDSIRMFCRFTLESEGYACEEAEDGSKALEALQTRTYDLALLDIDMPNMTGLEVLRQIREKPPGPHLKIIMFSGRATADEMSQMLVAGADNYLTKPFSILQLAGQAKAALRLKDAQDRSDLLNQRLLAINAELEHNLTARDSDLIHARNALVLALAKLVDKRDSETGAHVLRLQRYSRCLAEAAAAMPHFLPQIDPHFIDMLECCAPLHDIGKVGLPDHILLKPGKLSADERVQMQAHTIIGSETLAEVAAHHGSALAFLQMAIDIARHHHEHYDGTGYPDRLGGSAIPLAARIVAIADVYDALRSRRIYKPALSHTATLQIITEASPGHFDPALLQAFEKCAPEYERIYRELRD